MSQPPIRCACGQINKSNAISHSIYCEILWLLAVFLSLCLSFSLGFPLSGFAVYLLWSWLFISASHVLLCVFLVPMLSLCVHKHQSTCVRQCVWCVCVCMLTVHASLWDTLISAHCGSAPSCPHGWLLIETNQACDGPIAVTPHPSHLRPNHLLIGPRRAPSRWHGRLIWPVDEGSRRE